MITYKRIVPLDLISGSTEDGGVIFSANTVGDYYVRFQLDHTYRDLGLLQEITDDLILSANTSIIGDPVPSDNTQTLGQVNVLNGLNNNYLETRTPSAYLAGPLGTITGTCENKLSNIRNWGGELIEKTINNDNGYLTSSSTLITYIIDGIVYSTVPSTLDTTYTIPNNIQNIGIDELKFELENFIVKNEDYLNLSAQLRVDSQLFVDRNDESILERMYRLSEVQNIGNIEEYQNELFEIY